MLALAPSFVRLPSLIKMSRRTRGKEAGREGDLSSFMRLKRNSECDEKFSPVGHPARMGVLNAGGEGGQDPFSYIGKSGKIPA